MTATLAPDCAALPAGGLDPEHFDWREAWHPVHYVRHLSRQHPNRFTLLERDLVIWWDRVADQWRVFDDRCPHRLVPLSEGRVNEQGHLECPYHGWAFAGDGQCVNLPQADANCKLSAERSCAVSLPAKVVQDMLFVYAGDPTHADRVPVPLIEPLAANPEGWVVIDTFRDLPYDALTLLENVLDPSHVPYTHHKTVGNRSTAGPVNLELIESDRQGFRGVWPEGPRQGTLGRQDTVFIAPNLMWHDLTSKQFGRTMTVVYATPIRPGWCRLFARFPFQFASPIPAFFIRLTPEWYSHLGQNRILEDDQIFLHWQEQALATEGGSQNYARSFYLPTAADRFVIAFRNWVNHYKAEPLGNRPLPPRQPVFELMERYHSHTENCSSCRTAHARLQQVRLGLAILFGLVLALAPLTAQVFGTGPVIGLTLLSLVAGVSWLGLGRLLRQFYQGDPIPPRNRG